MKALSQYIFYVITIAKFFTTILNTRSMKNIKTERKKPPSKRALGDADKN